MRLTAAQILVDNRLGGKRDNLALVKRALLEVAYDGKCKDCLVETDPVNLKVYRIFDRPLDNREENLKLVCRDCWTKLPKQHWKKPTRDGMGWLERSSEEIMKLEDRKILKEIFKSLKNNE